MTGVSVVECRELASHHEQGGGRLCVLRFSALQGRKSRGLSGHSPIYLVLYFSVMVYKGRRTIIESLSGNGCMCGTESE